MSAALLRAAFENDEVAAHREWLLWRNRVDLNALSPDDFATLPLLSRRLGVWIENDPSKAILVGICKQAWSRNQTLLAKLARLCGELRARNLHPVITGTAAAVLLASGTQTHFSRGFLRISKLDLFLRMQEFSAAAQSMRDLGWQYEGNAVHNSISQIYLTNGPHDICILRRRLVSKAPSVASEYDAMAKIETAWLGDRQTIANPAWLLARELTQSPEESWLRRAWFLLECGVEWEHLQRALQWADSHQPAAARMKSLEAESGRPIPVASPSGRWKLSAIRHDYSACRQAAGDRKTGLLQYLRARWCAQSNAQLPGLALRMTADWVRHRPGQA